MNNKEYLEMAKNRYGSLKYFTIEGNVLFLNNFKIPLINVQLSSLNPSLFELNPTEIFQIIYMLELLYKPVINEEEKKFIFNYVTAYLKLNDAALEGQNVNNNELWCLSIPIYKSYDSELIQNGGSMAIQEQMNNHNNEIETGRGNHMALVLTNPNLPNGSYPLNTNDSIEDLTRAGFTTIILIAGAVALTCLYIAFFIFNS